MRKNIITSLCLLVGFLSVIPSFAKVAIKRQSAIKASSAPTLPDENTDGRQQHCVYLGGAQSATLYADAEGHTHLKVYDEDAKEEVEVNLEEFITFDEIPEKVKLKMKMYPELTYEEAYLSCDMRDEWEAGPVFDSDMFWEMATIYLCDPEEYDSNDNPLPSFNGELVNCKFLMTGGKLGAIVAAGTRSTCFERTNNNKDNGNVYIAISGGSIGFVATSVTATKHFSGTAYIYLQNCSYTGNQIPNVADDMCTTTVLTSGVKYSYASAVLNDNPDSYYYSYAAHNVLQSMDGKVITCFSKKADTYNIITNKIAVQPIECQSFIIKSNTYLNTYTDINTTNLLILAPDTKPSAYTLFVQKGVTVNTNRMTVLENVVIRNAGTINILDHDGYINYGNWEEKYVFTIGKRTVTVTCNTPVIKPETPFGDINGDGKVDITDVTSLTSLLLGTQK